ncbi:MAG: ABC transporter substrate-binding protein [Candidatus Thorarchaeota archaeon]
MNNSKELLSVVLILLMTFPMTVMSVNVQNAESVTEEDGAFLDRVEYILIEDYTQKGLSLKNGSIDMMIGYVPSSQYDDLVGEENIELETQLKYGYAQLIINCDKYPLNESAFRVALAYALNKTALGEPYTSFYTPEGTQPVTHDALLPKIHPYTAEGNLPASYHDPNIILANQTLDAGGFLDDDGDGWREAPDGSDFQVEIEVPAFSHYLEMIPIIDDTLNAIGIEGGGRAVDIHHYPDRLTTHGDFDVSYYRTEFVLGSFSIITPNALTLDVDFLKHHTSDNFMVENLNPCNWVNSTYDYWLSIFFNTSSDTQRREAIFEIQKIWFEECPSIILYNTLETVAYRTDKFQDLHVDNNGEIVFPWSSYLARLKNDEGGPFGGTLHIGYSSEIETFNYMKPTQVVSSLFKSMESSLDILEQLRVTLVNLDKNCEYIPWLAESYSIQNHDDNPSIPAGKSRITFQIRDDAKWSDGTSITADDVAYSLAYYGSARLHGNPVGLAFDLMTAAYSPLPLTVLVEFDVPYCYLDLSAFAVANIVPEGTFDGIDYWDWDDWNPVLGTDDFPMGGGPFILDSHTPGESTTLTVNPYFFNLAERTTPATITSPQDLSIDAGSLGNSIQWNITGAYPGTYEIHRNQVAIDDGNWVGESIEVSLDELTDGTHNFTLVIEDYYGMTSQNTVIVTVSSGGLPELFPMIAIGGVAVIVVIVGAVIVKKKR